MPAWLQWGGGATALATIIGMFIALAKVRPEVKKLKTDGATALVAAATTYSTELSDQVTELQNETRKLWQAQRAQEQRITAHVRWDSKVVETLRELGGEIADPPPLYLSETP
jgi:hypothetical protein